MSSGSLLSKRINKTYIKITWILVFKNSLRPRSIDFFYRWGNRGSEKGKWFDQVYISRKLQGQNLNLCLPKYILIHQRCLLLPLFIRLTLDTRKYHLAQAKCGFPGGSDCKVGDLWVGKIPWKRKWQPTPVFLPREFCGQRSLVDFSSSLSTLDPRKYHLAQAKL